MQTVLVDLGWISLPLQDCMSLVRPGNGSQVKSVLEGIKTYKKLLLFFTSSSQFTLVQATKEEEANIIQVDASRTRFRSLSSV